MEATSSSNSPELFCEEAFSGMQGVDETTQAVPATPQQPGNGSESPMVSDDDVSCSSESMSEVAAEEDEEPVPSKATPVRKRRRRSYVSNFLSGKARLVCRTTILIKSPQLVKLVSTHLCK